MNQGPYICNGEDKSVDFRVYMQGRTLQMGAHRLLVFWDIQVTAGRWVVTQYEENFLWVTQLKVFSNICPSKFHATEHVQLEVERPRLMDASENVGLDGMEELWDLFEPCYSVDTWR